MKTRIKLLQIFIMMLQIAIGIIPFIVGFIWEIIKQGFDNGYKASVDVIYWISNTE